LSSQPIAAAALSPAQQRRSLILCSIGIGFFWAAIYVYVPTLSVYADHRGASLGLVGAVVAAYGVTQFLLRVPTGMASDRWGVRKPFALGGFVAALAGCLVLAWAPSPGWLVVGRALAGVASSSWVATTVLLASYYRPDQAMHASALSAFVSGGAQMVAVAAGGWISERYGWLAPFWVGAVLAVVGLLVSLPIADDVTSTPRPVSFSGLLGLAASPLLLLGAGVAAVQQYISQSGAYGFVPVFASKMLHASQTELGTLTFIGQLTYVVGSLFAARIVNRLGARASLLAGLALTAVGTVLVPLAPTLLALGAIQAIAGAGAALIYTVTMGLAILGVAGGKRASAMGVYQALYAIGMFAGPAFSGWLAESVGLSSMFYASSLLPVVAVGVVLVVTRYGLLDGK
jgi:MFS family permease